MIHDGARPFVTQDMVVRSIQTLADYKACTVGMPVKDTIKIVNENRIGMATPAREYLWQIQTPQSFDYKCLMKCYQKMMKKRADGAAIAVTDDTMVVEEYGKIQVKVIEGSYTNIKITTPEDMRIGQEFLQKQG